MAWMSEGRVMAQVFCPNGPKRKPQGRATTSAPGRTGQRGLPQQPQAQSESIHRKLPT